MVARVETEDVDTPSGVELSAVDRMSLRQAVRAHPDVCKHAASPFEVNWLAKEKLLAVAQALGLDIEAILREGPQDDPGHVDEVLKALAYVGRYHAFNGSIPFELTLELLGKRIVRQARLSYEITPDDWDYYDLRKREVVAGWGSRTMWIEVLCAPETDAYCSGVRGAALRRRKARPEWHLLDLMTPEGFIPEESFDEFDQLVEADAKRQDIERRRHAGLK
jgi:hypothetical protein